MNTRRCGPQYECHKICPLAGISRGECPTVKEIYNACEEAGVNPVSVLLATRPAA